MYCRQCGTFINDNVKFCPNCGYPCAEGNVPPSVNQPHPRTGQIRGSQQQGNFNSQQQPPVYMNSNYGQQGKKPKRKKKSSFVIIWVCAILALCCISLGAFFYQPSSMKKTSEGEAAAKTATEAVKDEKEETVNDEKKNTVAEGLSNAISDDKKTEAIDSEELQVDADIIKTIEDAGYVYITYEDLCNYRDYLHGQKIYTVTTVSRVKEDKIQTSVEGSVMYQNFLTDKDYQEEVKSGENILIAGKVGVKEDLIVTAITDIENCHVYEHGKSAELYKKEASDSSLNSYFENAKKQAEAEEQLNTGSVEYNERIVMFNIYESFGDLRYDAIVEIENTGSAAVYLDSKSFDLETSDGKLVQTDSMISSCPDVLLPGEKGYFYNQFGSEINNQSIDVKSLKLVPHYTIEKANKIPHDYPLEDLSVADGTYGITLTGRVYNDSNEEDSIYVNVIYYDENMNCLGITGTNVYEMMPNQYTSFEVSGMGLQNGFDASRVKNYIIYARENVYQW